MVFGKLHKSQTASTLLKSKLNNLENNKENEQVKFAFYQEQHHAQSAPKIIGSSPIIVNNSNSPKRNQLNNNDEDELIKLKSKKKDYKDLHSELQSNYDFSNLSSNTIDHVSIAKLNDKTSGNITHNQYNFYKQTVPAERELSSNNSMKDLEYSSGSPKKENLIEKGNSVNYNQKERDISFRNNYIEEQAKFEVNKVKLAGKKFSAFTVEVDVTILIIILGNSYRNGQF